MRVIFFIGLFFMAIIVICWYSAEFKARAFANKCIYLERLINSSDVTIEAYETINQCFEELDCFSDADCKRKKSLWAGFQFRYESVSPYRIKETV